MFVSAARSVACVRCAAIRQLFQAWLPWWVAAAGGGMNDRWECNHAHQASSMNCRVPVCCCCLLARRRAATTINDQASIPDTLNTPRSSVDPIQQELVLELLDSFHSR